MRSKLYAQFREAKIQLTIREVAERTGLSAHTLRYYERVGLLGAIERDSGGYRRYDERALNRLKVLTYLRGCGMSIKGLQEYIELTDGDRDPDGYRRRAMLVELRESATAMIAEVQMHLSEIDAKIAMIDRHLYEREARLPDPVPAAR